MGTLAASLKFTVKDCVPTTGFKQTFLTSLENWHQCGRLCPACHERKPGGHLQTSRASSITSASSPVNAQIRSVISINHLYLVFQRCMNGSGARGEELPHPAMYCDIYEVLVRAKLHSEVTGTSRKPHSPVRESPGDNLKEWMWGLHSVPDDSGRHLRNIHGGRHRHRGWSRWCISPEYYDGGNKM